MIGFLTKYCIIEKFNTNFIKIKNVDNAIRLHAIDTQHNQLFYPIKIIHKLDN